MDKSGNVSYKYSCRKCPVRDRCIEQSDNSPSTKDAIKNAFENRTDTVRTWEFLQTNCLLVKAEKLRAQQTSAGSLLSLRLRRAREAQQGEKPQPVTAPSSDVSTADTKDKTPAIPRIGPRLKPKLESFDRDRFFIKPHTKAKKPERLVRLDEPVSAPGNERYWLTLRRGGRRIMLPSDGELVLGRYDPNFGIPPDVDLTYEDGPSGVISRRHARIIGQEGKYTIQEMGGRLGVFVNGRQISLGVAHQLKNGDKVLLGNCEMLYDRVPHWVIALDELQDVEHWVMMCSTGQRVAIPAGADLVVGRSDKYVNFTPDIDLAVLGDKAAKVSRRHARLFFKPGEPALYVEDMGSGFGTKINGELIMLGESRALLPGDHLWLGGCVLAYDITLR